MDHLAADALKDTNFLYVCNNDRKSPIVAGLDNCTKIPVICHGSNQFIDFDHIYLSPSLNRSPKHFKMLDAIGLTAEAVQTATAYETYYQCVMRTSQRNPGSNRPVTIIVPDKFIADHLGQMLGTTNIEKLGTLPEHPKPKPLSRKEIRCRLDSRGRWSAIFSPQAIVGDGGASSKASTDVFGGSCEIEVTFHLSEYDDEPSQFVTHGFDTQLFVEFMRKEAQTIVQNKDQRYFFNSGMFKPPIDSIEYRRQEYFQKSTFLILDFDSGAVSPEVFNGIFGRTAPPAQRRSYLIFNSYSNSPEKPNRFRVVMFYKRAVASISEHRAVYEWIVEVLELAGHKAGSSGLDAGCGSGNQSFYMAGINPAHPENAFFEAHWTKTRELAKYAINPSYCVSLYHEAPTVSVADVGHRKIATRDQIDRVTEPLRNAQNGTNQLGHDTVMKLAALGMSDADIESEMHQCANGDRKKLKRIPGYLKSLNKYRQGWTVSGS